jgi:hypothetical protein
MGSSTNAKLYWVESCPSSPRTEGGLHRADASGDDIDDDVEEDDEADVDDKRKYLGPKERETA